MEQKPSDIAIIDLASALKFALTHLSLDQITKELADNIPHEELRIIHGKLVPMIID